MKLQFLTGQADLAAAVGLVNIAIRDPATLPVLANAMLGCEAARITLVGENLQFRITTRVPAEIAEGDTRILVPGRLLKALVDLMPSHGSVSGELTAAGNRLELRAQGYRQQVEILPPVDFPDDEDIDRVPLGTIAASDLCEVIEKVTFAAASGDPRPALGGVELRVGNGSYLHLTALDGYRLATGRVRLTEALSGPCNMVIPARSLDALRRTLSASRAMVRLATREDWGRLECVSDEVQFASSLIGEEYPQYQELFPDQSVSSATMEVGPLHRAVSFALLFDLETLPRVALDAGAGPSGQGQIRITGRSQEVGSSDNTVPALTEGDPFRAVLSARHVLDITRRFPEDQLRVTYTDSAKPVLIEPVRSSNYRYVVMPMATPWLDLAVE